MEEFDTLTKGDKKKLLLHVCCAPCSTHSADVLKDNYDVSMYFYNPNIHPCGEYEKRLEECKRVAEHLGLSIEEGTYDVERWLEMISGFEEAPEGGTRCRLCFSIRLDEVARYAKEKGFDCFTTTMTISPHKDSTKINEIGERVALKQGVSWVHSDFKKQDGFRKSVELSNKLGLYRQKYCGCFYSVRPDID